MNCFPNITMRALACRAGTLLAVYCLSVAGVWTESNAGNSLNLSTGDIFTTSSELVFGGPPQPILFAQASVDPESTSNWETSRPPTDQFDWIQTTSGEWLKGELKVLYSDQLEFDSDEFGLQTIDWEDVAQLLSHGTKRLSIDSPEGPRVFDGVVTVDKEKITIVSSAGVERFDRSQLISITPGADSEQDNWSAKISFGLNFTRGNSELTDYILQLNVKRRTPENRFVVDYLGNRSESGDLQTVNNHRLSTFFDIFAAREYFWRPVFFEYYRDPFQNIDTRATIGIGAGYHIIDTPRTTWDVSGGPAYRTTRYVSVEPGDSDSVDTPALVVGTFYDTVVTKSIDFNTRYNLSIVNQDSGSYTHHAIATFETEVTSILDFDVSFIWDRIQDPQARADGSVPKQDDFQLLLTLGVDM